MDRVGGGFEDFVALQNDPRALDDVLIVMEAEAEAAQILSMRARAG